jgi:hypothetical protein
MEGGFEDFRQHLFLDAYVRPQEVVDVHLADETVWLNQAHMTELFQRNKRTVSEHLKKQLSGISGQLPMTAKVIRQISIT